MFGVRLAFSLEPPAGLTTRIIRTSVTVSDWGSVRVVPEATCICPLLLEE